MKGNKCCRCGELAEKKSKKSGCYYCIKCWNWIKGNGR